MKVSVLHIGACVEVFVCMCSIYAHHTHIHGRMGSSKGNEMNDRGKVQMCARDIESTRRLANLRIHVERVIGAVCNKYHLLRGTVPLSFLLRCEGEECTNLDKIVYVCCALTNLCPSVVLN